MVNSLRMVFLMIALLPLLMHELAARTLPIGAQATLPPPQISLLMQYSAPDEQPLQPMLMPAPYALYKGPSPSYALMPAELNLNFKPAVSLPVAPVLGANILPPQPYQSYYPRR